MAARNVESATKCKETIVKDCPNATIDIMELDVSSLESVRKFANEFIDIMERKSLDGNICVVSKTVNDAGSLSDDSTRSEPTGRMLLWRRKRIRGTKKERSTQGKSEVNKESNENKTIGRPVKNSRHQSQKAKPGKTNQDEVLPDYKKLIFNLIRKIKRHTTGTLAKEYGEDFLGLVCNNATIEGKEKTTKYKNFVGLCWNAVQMAKEEKRKCFDARKDKRVLTGKKMLARKDF
ncbi:hypothetical protein Tco_0071364 [Tanacetum coccineum]